MVYVNASRDESCDLPMVEANACDVPAVVFDCRGDYSDHCEYIKYGIVVNDVEDFDTFGMSMIWIDHYHLCTRHLGINCLIPVIPQTKFYDFPMNYNKFMDYCKEKGVKVELSVKRFHEGAMQIIR